MLKFVIFVSLLFGLLGTVYGKRTYCRNKIGQVKAICSDNEECCGDDNDDCCSTGLSTWQLAAIGVAGFVGVCIIIILIVACVQKSKKKNKVSQPTHTGITTISQYDEPPPMYSMGPSRFGQASSSEHPPPYMPRSEEKKPL